MGFFVSLSPDRTCISNSEYNNIVTGTCDPCPNVCVGGCSGTALAAGDGGCNMCATILVDGDNVSDSSFPGSLPWPYSRALLL